MDRNTSPTTAKVSKVISPNEIVRAREVVRSIYIDEKVKEYIVSLVLATREPDKYGLKDLRSLINFGASPRATISLNLASKAHAFLKRRGFVTPEDVKAIGADVLRHRIILTYEAEAEEITTEKVIQRLFDPIPVP